MENATSNKKRKATHSVELDMDTSRIFECPICLETFQFQAPVYQCARGHLLCEECEMKLNQCPSCQLPLEKRNRIRNLALEQLSEAVIHDCPNRVEGCSWKGRPQALKLHLVSSCQYEETNCCSFIGINCNQRLKRLNWSSHLREIHGFEVANASQATFTEVIPELHNMSGITTSRGKILITPTNVFVVTSHIDALHKSMAWMVRYWGCEKLEDYYCKIKVTDNQSSRNSQRRPIANYSGPLFAIPQEYRKDIQILTIGFQELEDLRTKKPAEKNLKLRVKVSVKKSRVNSPHSSGKSK